jgi:hypothetical protein
VTAREILNPPMKLSKITRESNGLRGVLADGVGWWQVAMELVSIFFVFVRMNVIRAAR